MKKILSILMIAILGCVVFAGCGESKKTESYENKISAAGDEIVSGGNVYDVITSIYKDVNIEYKSEDEQLTGTKNLYIGIKLDKKKKTPQVLSEEYNKVCKEILKKVSPILAKYENLNNVQFQAFVNDKPDEDTNIYCLRQINDKNEIYYDLGAVTEAKNFELKTKAEKEEEENKAQQAMDNMNEQLKEKEKNQIVKVPDEDGYFEAPKLLENIKKRNIQLKSSNFKVVNENGKKIVKINLIYKNEVLIVGVVKNIRNNIESALSNQCDEIDLTITQENPMDIYECKYIDGSWDKEVK
ncbi:hypothetical protein [Clostridium botulinum]|uniref:hypothetical protein n=1 Tax=Clostridium botulinum TaxID=1491 RepID=UPI000A16FFDA|nr:hypothetical protein [Clostridium botulinum]AUN10451.1 hypothetical protein RSJ6_08030 [Clostridium botulinum]OSA66529.1 hypothetical protein B2H87_18690 [Clostridium botulinum]